METHQIMAVVNQIVVNKEERQLTEWKQPVTGDGSNLAIALSGNSINKSTVEDLKQVLRLLFIKVGLRAANFPSSEEKDVLISHIINNYGNHTPLEIRLAFEMAITFKLDLNEKEIPCYENFSCAYVSKIMNAYRKWASEEHKQLIKQEVMPEIKELEPMEMIEWINEYKSKSNIVVDLIPLSFYDFLLGSDMIAVSKEIKKDYFNKATTNIKTDLFNQIPICKTTDALRDFKQFEVEEKEGFKQDSSIKTRVINKAKKLIVYDYLKKK